MLFVIVCVLVYWILEKCFKYYERNSSVLGYTNLLETYSALKVGAGTESELCLMCTGDHYQFGYSYEYDAVVAPVELSDQVVTRYVRNALAHELGHACIYEVLRFDFLKLILFTIVVRLFKAIWVLLLAVLLFPCPQFVEVVWVVSMIFFWGCAC